MAKTKKIGKEADEKTVAAPTATAKAGRKKITVPPLFKLYKADWWIQNYEKELVNPKRYNRLKAAIDAIPSGLTNQTKRLEVQKKLTKQLPKMDNEKLAELEKFLNPGA